MLNSQNFKRVNAALITGLIWRTVGAHQPTGAIFLKDTLGNEGLLAG